MRVSRSQISITGKSNAPATHLTNGRMPIAAFMGVAPVVLTGVGIIGATLVDAVLIGLSNAIEEGIREVASNLARGGK